jgi:hypothetical protein
MSENEQWDRLCMEMGRSETVDFRRDLNMLPKSSPYFLLALQLKPGKYLNFKPQE